MKKKTLIISVCLIAALVIGGVFLWRANTAPAMTVEEEIEALLADAAENGGHGVYADILAADVLPADFLGEDFTGEAFIPEGISVDSESALAANILGSDDRITITNTSAYPYSAIAYIYGKFACGCGITGTGFLINSNTIMTAGHCMRCAVHNADMASCAFYFGYHGWGKYDYKYNGYWRCWNYADFSYGYTEYNDFAFVKLDNSNVGERMGWFGLWNPGNYIESYYYNLSGYVQGVMSTNVGVCDILSDTIVDITMDTIPGNSGCPIYTDDYYAVAMCISASRDTYNPWNHAYRITDNVLYLAGYSMNG